MSILQISKIQHRSGNLVDLPQLDEAEFGWASDAKRLFIGKTVPNENIEVLTSYSSINFSQINGAVGNLNISPLTVENGQVLAFDGENWINRGGFAGGLITLGDVSNVKLTGGAIGYVLETDGTGNLSWTPKSTVVAYIKNIELGNGAPGNYTVVTTTADSAFGQGAAVTITGVIGTTELNGGTYYVSLQTANSFALFNDANLTSALDSTGFGDFPYTTVSATSTVTDQITVADATYFTIGDPVVFSGDLGNSTLDAGRIYYIINKDTTSPNTWITVSKTVGGTTVDPGTATGLSADVYAYGGRLISSVNSGGGGVSFPGGSNTSIQFNRTSTFAGSADFTYNDVSKLFTLNGNANVGNLNATGVATATRFISNVATGTTPIEVVSTTRVPNLNVGYANVSDFSAVTEASTGTFYPVFAPGNSSANYSLGANLNLSFNALTGNLSTQLLNVTSNANVGNLGASGRIIATGNVAGGNLSTAGTLSATGNANVGNLGTGEIVATGNATALSFVSTVATGTAPLVVNSTTQVANLNSATAGQVTTNAQPNITSVGTLTSLDVAGNITSGNVYSNSGTIGASLLTGTITTNAQPNITSLGTLTSLDVTGNISTATGNLSAGNISTTGSLEASNVSFTGSNISLGDIDNVHITGGTSGFVIVTDGTGNLTFANPSAVGTQPAGSNTQVQYNDSGSLGASSAFTFNEVSNTLEVSGSVTSSRLVSTVATGTAPLVVNSTTQVANLNAATAGTVRTNAQPNITSLGTLTGLLVSGTANITTVNATTGVFTNVSGSGAGLTNLPGANVTGKVANAVYADNAGSAGSVAWTNVSGRPTQVSAFTNDAGYITAAQAGGFPSGTRMLFAQSTAPTGWTKDTSATLNDAALRVVTGSAGTGGSVNFTSAFTVQTASGSVGSTSAGGTVGSTAVAGTVGDTALSESQMPAHSHLIATNTKVNSSTAAPFSASTYLARETDIGGDTEYNLQATYSPPGALQSGTAGSGATHTHSFTSPSHSHTFSGTSHTHAFTGSSINLSVKYVDVIVATKN